MNVRLVSVRQTKKFIGKGWDVKSETTSLRHFTKFGHLARVWNMLQACPNSKLVEGVAIQQHNPAFLPLLFTFQRMCTAFSFIWASQKS